MITLSNWFASSIRVKVLIGFTAVVALFLMMAGVGYFQLNQVRRSSQKVVLLSQQMAQSHEFALAISSLNSNLEQYMVIGGSQIEGKLFKDIDRMTATVARLKKLELDSTSPTVADLDRLTEVLKTEMTTLVKMDANGALSGEIDRQLLSVYGQIDQTEELHHRLAGETLRDLQRITAIQESTLIRVLNQLLVLAPLTLIFAIGASVLMAQGIVNPLSKLTEVATRIAGGELETRAPVTGRDETARLAISFNSMTEQLNGLIRNLEQKVSDLKRTETALRESEERCRSLFEGTPVGIYRITPSGQFLDVNPTLVDILGYPDRETLLAQNVDNLYVQAVVHKEWQALVEREGVVRGFEAEWRRHDGSVIWVKNTGRVVRDDNGQVLYYEGSLDDITEWMQAEKSLRESEEKYRQLFELESDAVFLIDNETGRILEANTAASTMYGYTREELLSKKNSDLSAEPEETRRVTQATPIIEDQIVFSRCVIIAKEMELSSQLRLPGAFLSGASGPFISPQFATLARANKHKRPCSRVKRG